MNRIYDMPKNVIILLFTFILTNLNAQDFHTKIDSIRVKYIDFNLKTVLALDKGEIEFYKNQNFYKEIVITDSSSLNKFSIIKLQNDTLEFVKHLDYRMEIEIYNNKNLIYSIGLDRSYSYDFKGLLYLRNFELIKWLHDLGIRPNGELYK